ncbi:MAG: YihY/virulence factor BrkB family protein [Porticoccaceae bacterium]|nr:YihY/virulence factor BrkB family protein [Porticoccaceae bacterium]
MQPPADLVQQAQQFLTKGLWRADVSTMPLPRRICYRAARLLVVVVQDLTSGQLTLRAMSLVYTTLLSLVPLLAVSFSVLKAFGVHNQIEPLLLNLVEPLGPQGEVLMNNILGFVENMKVGVLGALGLAMLLYTVVSLIQKVEDAFNHVWHTKSSRSLSRRFSDYLSVIMVGPVLVFSAMGITASLMSTDLVQTLISIEPFGTLLLIVTRLVPFMLVLLAFSFLYMLIPNTKVKFSSALVGALVGGGLWQLSGLVFAEFASSSTRYDAVYSGFAIVILAMIWLYLSWLILLFGAQVAYYYQHPEQIRPDNLRVPLNGRLQEQLALLVMFRVTERFVAGEPPQSLDALAQQLQMPGDRVSEALALLSDRGLLLETNDDPPCIILASDPASLSLAELLVKLRDSTDGQALLASQLRSSPVVDKVLAEMDSALTRQLEGITLRDLALGHEKQAPMP